VRRVVVFISATVLALALAAPAFAATDADGVGPEFGQHHSARAQEMDGFTRTMNRGVMHQCLAGWEGM